MSWSDAFRRQARSGFDIFIEFNRSGRELCHQLHYFQMATEKLAKSFLASDTQRPPRGHSAFVCLLQVIKSRPDVRRWLRYPDARAFAQYMNSLLDTAWRIQSLAPTGGIDKPNAEYPWWDASTVRVVSPLDHPFPGLNWRDTNLVLLRGVVRRLLEYPG